MLTRKKKEEIVKDLTAKLKEAKSLLVVDYTGLSVAAAEELRAKLLEQKAEMKVIKKTLLAIAFKNIKLDLDLKSFKNQLAVAFGADEVMPAKTLVTFAKTNEDLPKIIAGAMGDKILEINEIKELAALPGYEEMLGKTVMVINAPLSGFVQALAGNMRNLVYALKAVADSKSE